MEVLTANLMDVTYVNAVLARTLLFSIAQSSVICLGLLCLGHPRIQTGASFNRRLGGQAYQYVVIDLDTSPSEHLNAEALNQNGEIVGPIISTDGEDDGVYAFHWQQGKITRFKDRRYWMIFAEDINSQGLIVGHVTAGWTGPMQAVIWKNGKRQFLPRKRRRDWSMALGVNDKEQIVGNITDPSDPINSIACLWDKDHITLLPGLNGQHASEANRINSVGQIIGSLSTRSQRSHPCLWDNGRLTDLMPGQQDADGRAMAINAAGAVVGDFSDDYLRQDDAYLYKNGRLSVLPHLPKCHHSVALGIDNAMNIVGSSGTGHVIEHCSAVMWHDGKVFDLNTLIDPSLDWHLYSARAINDQGEIIGSGLLHGELHEYLMRPTNCTVD